MKPKTTKSVLQKTGTGHTLPPWDDNQAMYRWVDRMLDDEDDEEYTAKFAGPIKTKGLDPNLLIAFAIENAWGGDLELLRKMYPQLVPFLALPPVRVRNARRKSSHELTDTGMLAITVKRINAIWKEHFGHVNRKRGLITAVEIASRRFGFDRSAINKYQHPSGPSGKRKAAK